MTDFQASESDLRRLVEAQATVIDLLGPNAPFNDFLHNLSDLFAQQMEGSTVSILIADDERKRLIPGVGSRGESPGTEIDWSILIAEGSGASGTAAFRREAVFLTDTSEDPSSDDLKITGATEKVRAVWVNPLLGSDGQLLGVITMLWPAPATPEPRQVWLMDNFSRIAGSVIERYRLQQSISQLLADERRAIAQDLHDDPIQAVTAASLRVQRLLPAATPEQRERLTDIHHSLSGAIDRMRSMLFELHPPTLDDEGLGSAVELYLYERLDPLDIAWDLQDRLRVEPSAATQSLAYRLTREALSNVARHSQATQVTVTLENADEGIHIRIVDNGVGCDIESALHGRAGHLGTVSSRHLAQRASGRWTINSTPGEGTTVEFWVPTGHLS